MSRISKGLLLCTLTLMSFIMGIPLHSGSAISSPQNGITSNSLPVGSQYPQSVGADAVPDLRLPKSVASNVDDLIGAGGVIQNSSDNMTIYNLGIRMRLLGGTAPHDELFGPNGRLSSWSFWGVETSVANVWMPLVPRSSNFTVQGTNSTGTYLTRSMRVSVGLSSGTLQIVYRTTLAGSLKWTLEFFPDSPGLYRLAYSWWNTTNRYTLSQASRHFSVDYGVANYTLSWEDVPAEFNSTTNFSPRHFTLLVGLGGLLARSEVVVDPTISTSTSPSATSYTFQRKVFYEPKGGRYWAFFYDGIGTKYSNSSDGKTWSSPQTPSGWPAYGPIDAFSPSIFNSGQTVIMAMGTDFSTSQSFGYIATVSLYFIVGNISGSQISWSAVRPAGTRFFACGLSSGCSLDFGYRYVSVAVGSDGSVVFSANWYLQLYNGCNGGSSPYSESQVVAVYRGYPLVADGRSGCGQYYLDQDKSLVLPSDSHGSVRLIYQFQTSSGLQLRTRLLYGAASSQTVNPVADSYTNSSNQGANYSGGSSGSILSLYNFYCCNGNINEQDFSFLTFNLPTVSGGQFYSSFLTLNIYGTNSSPKETIVVDPASGIWDEAVITYQNQPGGSNPNGLTAVGVVSTQAATSYATGQVQINITPTIAGMYKPSGDMNGWPNNGIVVWTSDPVHQTFAHAYSQESSSPPALNVTFSCCMGPSETIEPNIWAPASIVDSEFSGVSDANYGIHVAYQGGNNDNLTYAYKSSSATSWAYSPSLAGTLSYPTLTVDYSTNDVYLFYFIGGSIVMRVKTPVQQWTDSSPIYAVTNINNPKSLGSNFASTSGSNSSQLALLWTSSCANGPYCVSFASIPINTVWSPYAAPADPWDGNGIAPYGQYFANLGEYVSPGTGMLTIKQSDLTVPGRGLDLFLTRVYTEPYSFLSGQPYNYERYPWAPLGYGWQLNFPWLNGTQKPIYIHLWDGEGYRIPSSFWASQPSTFENHSGEHFVLLRNATGIFLYTKSGIAYKFDPSNLNRLTQIIDPVGNGISIGYDASNRISVMNDTVQRRFLFCYNNGLLASINQTTGNCLGGAGSIRGIVYKYSGQSLVTVYDPAGRATRYGYGAVSDPNIAPWILSQITYPTNWFTSYSYSQATLGTQAITYRVYIQRTNATSGFSGSTIRRFQYNYASGPGDQVANSFVLAYDGSSTVPATNTTYAFSFAGLTMNITDGSHNFVRGLQQRFGVHGEVPREIVLVTDGSTIRSYTNYYRYDLWGNRIYSRMAINPSTNSYHETFNAYYNDGLPPKFNAFQETFSQGNRTVPDNPWSTFNGTWSVKNGVYNGTESSPVEESVFAWANVSRADLSLQANVSVTRPVDTKPGYWLRFGIFTHLTTSVYKWALVIHTSSSSPSLELLDEWSSWLGDTNSSARNICSSWTLPLITYGVWYTFNMTVHGKTATGWVSAPGQSRCSVSGTFSPSSPAVSGTGFGLYAGGYSTLFDNVTATTVTPTITRTGFSNSFYQNGAPGPTIHSAMAGAAELQNGTGSAPIESYYNYDYWGHLLQTRQLYNSPGGIQWLATSQTHDGYGNPLVTTDAQGNSTNYGYSSSYKGAYLTSVSQTLKPGGIPITRLYSYNFADGTMLSSVDALGHNTTYRYDILGRLTKTTILATGDTSSYSYNDGANYVNVTNEMGWKTQQQYDGLGRLSRIIRFLNGAPYSNQTYTYNWQGKTTTDADSLGNRVAYQYDSLGRIIMVTKPDMNTTSVAYNELASWTRTTDENGINKCSVYDRLGRLVSLIENADPKCLSGVVTNYYYDETGNLLEITPANYNLISNPGFETDDLTGWAQIGMTVGTVAAHSGQFGAASAHSNNAVLQQNLTRPVPGNSVKQLQFWYDWSASGIFGEVLYSDGTYTQTNLPRVTQWTLLVLTFDRTKSITGIKIVEPSSVFSSLFLDDFLLSTSSFTTYRYNNLNQLIQTSYPDGTSQSYVYDNNDNLVGKIDRGNVRTSYAYDSLNRRTSISYSGSSAIDQYTYDVDGNLLSLSSQNATLTDTYDSRNRLTCETYQINSVSFLGGPCNSGGGGGGSVAVGTLITLADGTNLPVQNLQPGTRLLAYNVTTGQFAASTITRMTTVETNDLLVIQTQDGQPLRTDNATIQKLWVKKADGSIGWLSVSRLRVGDSLFLAQAQRWTVVISIKEIPGRFVMYDIYASAPFDYIANGYLDPNKLPTMSTPSGVNAASYSFKYGYGGEVLRSITYDDSSILLYNYDGLGRILNMTDSTNSGTTYSTKFSYYSNDELKGIQYGNGLIENYTYNKLGLVSRETLNNTSTPYLILNYQYNKTGTVASVMGQVYHTSIAEQYAYDPLQRLVNTSLKNNSTTSTLSYVYDNVGNRLSQTVNGIATSYSYNMTNNELIGSTVSGATTTYGYDKNGNLLSKNVGSNHSSYTWDVPGDLLNVANNSGVQGYYAYDGLGRRVESKEGSSTIFYGYLGTETLAEGVTNPYTDYIYANSLRIARVTGAYPGGIPAIFYFHTDALGSTRLVTDSNKNVLFTDNYQPFGQDSQSSGSETYKFTGKPYSTATGLYYEYARWYDPSIGRFISQDPFAGYLSDPQSLNPYLYVMNTPTSFIDPSGMYLENGVWHDDPGCGWTSNWGACGLNAITTGGDWYESLSPEEKQIVGIGAFAALTFATGGTDLLIVGAAGFAVGAGAYTGYTYATGGTPTLSGALFWGSVGFTVATIAYGGYRLWTNFAARVGEDSLIDASFSSRYETLSHWIRHGLRMGDLTPSEYVGNARSLIEEGYSGEAELWVKGSGTDLYAVKPGTGQFVVYNPFQNIIRTYMEHPGGYAWIRFQIDAQGWKVFPID